MQKKVQSKVYGSSNNPRQFKKVSSASVLVGVLSSAFSSVTLVFLSGTLYGVLSCVLSSVLSSVSLVFSLVFFVV